MAFLSLQLVAIAEKPTKNNGWDTLKIGGRSYVSIRSMKAFYRFDTMARSGKKLTLDKENVRIQFTVGGYQCLMNSLKFILSHPVVAVGDDAYISQTDLTKLINPVLRPNLIRKGGVFRTVILDAGHGGKDPGATNSFGTEAKYNLKLALRTKKMLEAKGFTVKMIRSSNRFYSLEERVRIANSVKGNAVFISLHFNAGQRKARGIETFTLSPPGVAHYGSRVKASDGQARAGNNNDSANIALATAVHGMVLRQIGKYTLDRGIKRARFSVLSGIKHPAVLFEGGFMSNRQEARLIDSDSYQNRIATGLVDAVIRYKRAINRGEPAQQRR